MDKIWQLCLQYYTEATTCGLYYDVPMQMFVPINSGPYFSDPVTHTVQSC